MGRMSRFLMTSVALGAAFIPQATPAFAQDEETAEDERIIVTARRRAEPLFETPAAVTAISGDAIDRARLQDIESIIQLTPNANVPLDPQGINQFINIRGIRNFDPQAEPAFGVYRNGIYFGGVRTNLGAQVDLERVEVLRGPQGGLYGRNAVGGTVNVVYAMPTDEFEGSASVSYESFDRSEIEGVVNIPVTENFAIRGAGWAYNQENGEFFNVFLDEEIDEQEDYGGRFSARWTPLDELTFTWVVEYQDREGPSLRAFAPNGVAQTLNPAVVSQPETEETIRHDVPSDLETNQLFISQDIEYKTDYGTFNLIAAYRDYELSSQEDQDFTPFGADFAPAVLDQRLIRDETVESYYVELLWSSRQVGPFSAIAGISYFDEEFIFDRTIETFLNLDALGDPSLVGLGIASANGALFGQIDTTSLSAFAEVTYTLMEGLEFFASVRWTEDDKALDYDQFVFSDDPVTLPVFQFLFAGSFPTFSLETEPSFVDWSPGGGVSYKVSETLNVYARVNTGFRAGSFNTTATNPAFIPYGEEQAINYELGAKALFLDGRVGVALAAFRTDHSDVALRRDDPVDTLFSFSFLDNVGDIRTYGFEVEANAQITPWLAGVLTFGWLDAEFENGIETGNDPSGGSTVNDLSGNQLPFARDISVNVLLDARVPIINDDWYLLGLVNGTFASGGYIDNNNDIEFEDETVIDLAAGIEYKNWRLIAFVDNVTDDRVTTFQFFNGAQTLTLGRRFGGELSVRF